MSERPAIEVTWDEEGHRYVASIDGAVAGFAVDHVRGDHHYFVHTEVGDAYEGMGVGSSLARGALDDVRAKGQRVVPLCPFISGWIDKHPDYEDLVDRERLASLGA